ncbi:methionyl-tRNA formyltransferase [Paenibacillus sp. GSMTC-2017]|uniref:methionyl-tRNA formyltransferase n=1 Tax=Paenibacillus sp. GSMTC-2017 TaxID=2794350 RepID=UPI0018D7F65C|nr:methionyl-tRNA formyltransferase [Paenibacillus sp. GSMTC-2017]MBH5316758.1 methionyl-tRNA formyltransferase [Paenibacillus sp. GSMTC-2017]
MRIVFMGTPDFAVPSLKLLIETGYEIVAVVTQPDRPKGRKKTLTPPPVKEAALSLGLPVLQPEKMRSPEAVAELATYEPDLIVTAAYGQILPKALLQIPRLGCINVHGSLLPKYRGGAPIQRSIINGESSTGVTIMYMAEGLDTGDMISRVELPILDEDTSGTMFEKLSLAGAKLLGETLPEIIEGRAVAVPQNNDEATYAPNLSREDERLVWNKSARELFNQVRGLSPMAGAFTQLGDEVFKVWACQVLAQKTGNNSKDEPGTIVDSGAQGIVVQTGQGTLLLTSIQPAGKRVMDAAEWVKGARIEAGTRFTAGGLQ